MEEKEIQIGSNLFNRWKIQFEYFDGKLFYPNDYHDYHQQTNRQWKNLEIFTITTIDGIYKLTLICLSHKPKYGLYDISHHESMVFGRSGDFIFNNPLISYQHFILKRTSLGWQIEDKMSENGIYLNGKRVRKAIIQLGDCVFFAGKRIYYLNKYLLVEKEHDTLLELAQMPNLKQKKNRLTDVAFHEEDLYVEIPTFKVTEVVEIENQYHQLDGSFAILIYPLIMWIVNPEFSRIVFLVASLGMFFLRQLFLYLNMKKQIKFNKNREKQRMTINLIEHVYTKYIMEHDYPLIEPLRLRVRRNGNYLYRSNKQNNYGTVRLGLEMVLFNPLVYETVSFKYESIQLLVYIFYQWIVYYPLKMVFLVDSLHDLGGLRYLSSLYCEGHFLVSFKKEDDQIILNRYANEPILVFSKRQTTCAHTVIYLNQDINCECMINFDSGHYVDYVQCVSINFKPIKIDHFEHIYEYFKYKQVQLSTQLNKNNFFNQFPKPFDLSVYYQNSNISEYLKVYLGFEQGRPLILDLHNDPHVLIAGMTGSGKSELLNHLILSLATIYSTNDVNFFLIDFKGGGLSHSFINLPHVCMTLTNLEFEQTIRALYALKDELKNRQEILLKRSSQLGYHLRDIHDLKRSQFKDDFGHLMIVVDEFAELKKMYPDFLNELISISRVGRSLGVHLILSTQHPSGIVDQQILANMSTRIILRVNSKSDSLELLGSNKAAELKQPGEFYLLSQEKMHKGRCHLIHEPIEQNQCQAILYDCEWNRRIELNHHSQMHSITYFEFILTRINKLCHKVDRLYIHACPDSIPYQYSSNFRRIEIGVLDDFYNRKLQPLIIDGAKGILWIGENLASIQAFISVLRRTHNYCFGNLSGDFIYVESNNMSVIDFLKQLPEDSFVVFYEQASKFETNIDLYPYLANQRHFTYCFVENNATFLRIRLLQTVGMCLVNDNLNDLAVFNRKSNVHIKTPLQFKVQINQMIYLGCLMEVNS